MTTVSEHLAQHLTDFRSMDLGVSTLGRTKELLIDSLGVGIAGSGSAVANQFLGGVSQAYAGNEARVPGLDLTLSAEGAAMVFAHNMHCLEFDAIHEGAVVHPLTVVVPVLLAEIQRGTSTGGAPVTGMELLRSIVVGVEVAARLGIATSTPLRFFRPGTAGLFGAVAAVGYLRKMKPPDVANAMGIAFGQVCGTMQAHTEGVPMLAAQVGFNARSAVLAIALHDAGMVGPRQVFEGEYGYFALIEAAGDLDVLTRPWGDEWQVNATSIKPYPTGRATHGAIDACRHFADSGPCSEVRSLEAEVPTMVFDLVARPPTAVMSANYARLCISAVMAIAFNRGSVTLADIQDTIRLSERELAIAQSVSVQRKQHPDPNAFMPQTFRAISLDGSIEEFGVTSSLGSPSKPLSEPEIVNKFVDCVESSSTPFHGSPEAYVDRLLDLDTRADALDVIFHSQIEA